jgi:hypothetical protein
MDCAERDVGVICSRLRSASCKRLLLRGCTGAARGVRSGMSNPEGDCRALDGNPEAFGRRRVRLERRLCSRRAWDCIFTV